MISTIKSLVLSSPARSEPGNLIVSNPASAENPEPPLILVFWKMVAGTSVYGLNTSPKKSQGSDPDD